MQHDSEGLEGMEKERDWIIFAHTWFVEYQFSGVSERTWPRSVLSMCASFFVRW